MIKFIRSLQENNSPRSKVWLVDYEGGLWVHKVQPKYYCDNEQWALELLQKTGFVPEEFIRLDNESLLIAYVEPQPITNEDLFRYHCEFALRLLDIHMIRHGDLTRYSVIPHDNRPIMVDWAECRCACDPRPDKRREGDAYWMTKTMEELCGE